MTTATLEPPRRRPRRGGYGFRAVARMEWEKLRTVRSTWYIVALFAASLIGLAVLALSHEGYAQMSAADRASFDPTHDCFIGLVLGQLLAGALGVLAITSEFSSGMIRATFAAVPQPPARARREGSRARGRHAGWGRGHRLLGVPRRPGSASVPGPAGHAGPARRAARGPDGRRLPGADRAHRPGPRRGRPAHRGRHLRLGRRAVRAAAAVPSPPRCRTRRRTSCPTRW